MVKRPSISAKAFASAAAADDDDDVTMMITTWCLLVLHVRSCALLITSSLPVSSIYHDHVRHIVLHSSLLADSHHLPHKLRFWPELGLLWVRLVPRISFYKVKIDIVGGRTITILLLAGLVVPPRALSRVMVFLTAWWYYTTEMSSRRARWGHRSNIFTGHLLPFPSPIHPASKHWRQPSICLRNFVFINWGKLDVVMYVTCSM